MWWSRRILTGDALLARAQELGVNTEGDARLDVTLSLPYPPQASEHEIQRRVLDAERHLRERRLFLLTMGSVAGGVVVGIGSLLATIHNGNQQTENAKRLLSVQLAREFRDGFDSEQMQRHRAVTAAALLRSADPPTDDVPDFFDTMGHYVRQGALDKETVWNDFGYTIMHYWPALKAYVASARTGSDGDPEDWVNFEWLNDKLLQEAADRRHSSATQITPGAGDVQEFLKDEAALLPPAKQTMPRKVRRGSIR